MEKLWTRHAADAIIASVGTTSNAYGGNVAMNWTVGKKLATGFGSIIALVLILGGLAIWSMQGVKYIAAHLESDNIPEVAVANQVERSSMLVMHEIRGYAYTEEKKFIDSGNLHLAKVKAFLKEAQDLAAKRGLRVLKENAEKAEAKVLEYEKLLAQTEDATKAMKEEKDKSLVAADAYMNACSGYLADLEKVISDEIKAGDIQAVKLLQDFEKTRIVNDLIDIGSSIRIDTWRAISNRDPKLFTEAQAKFAEVDKKLNSLKAMTTQEKNLKQIEDCRAAGKAYSDCMTKFLVKWNLREELNSKRETVAEGVLKAASETAQTGLDDTGKGAKSAVSALVSATFLLISGLAIALAIAILSGWLISSSVSKTLKRIAAALSAGASQTSDAASQVASSSEALAQGASEQASSIEETSASVEEMSSMTKLNAENADRAKGMAANAMKSAEKGSESMTMMAKAIDDIKKSSDSTAKIVKTIDEIAFQTNLLALNAAVEAARAGEAGKGFAVVAEEVRNLAQRSAEAAKSTATLIEESVKNANNGVEISKKTAESLKEIYDAAKQVNEILEEIASACKQQSEGISQIGNATSEMEKVTQSNSAGAEESASASEQLSSQAEEMKKLVRDLLAIVGGAGTELAPIQANPALRVRGEASASQASSRGLNEPGRKSLSHAAKPALAKPGKKALPAQEAIPLDDDDLKQF